MTNSRNSDEGQRRDTVEAERELFQKVGLKRIRIMGINALGVLHRHRADLLAILRRGGSVDVLLLDPNGEAFRKQRDSEEKRNGRVSNRLLKEMEASLAILRDILLILLDESEEDIEAIGQRFRIRLYDREARISLLFSSESRCLRNASPLGSRSRISVTPAPKSWGRPGDVPFSVEKGEAGSNPAPN